MNIVIFAHLQHPDYPWSVGKVRRIWTRQANDSNMEAAEAIVERIAARQETHRLRAFWRIAP